MPPALNADGAASGGGGGGGGGGGRKVSPAADEVSSLPHAEAVASAVETVKSIEQDTLTLSTSGTTSVMATGEFRSTTPGSVPDRDGLTQSSKKQTKVTYPRNKTFSNFCPLSQLTILKPRHSRLIRAKK